MASFKDFLEDYDAKEEASISAFLKDYSDGHLPPDATYPPPERLAGVHPPYANPIMCNVWGLIPFHGSVLLTLPPVDNLKTFDLTLEDRGVTAKSISSLIEFARETKRLAFALGGHASWYRNLEFLEPLFREFRPPRGVALPLEGIVGERNYRAESLAFADLARASLAPFVMDFMEGSGGPNKAQFEQQMNNLADVYVHLRGCGYSSLSDTLETEIVTNPEKAFRLLVLFDWFVTQPVLDPSGSITVMGDAPLKEVRSLVGLSSALSHSMAPTMSRYDIGRFILEKRVRFPETEEGCRVLMEAYDSANLRGVRAAFHDAVRQNDATAIMENSQALTQVCEEVWVQSDSIRWAERIGTWSPTVSLGIVGAVAAAAPGHGILFPDAGIGTAIAPLVEKMFDGPISGATKRGIARLMGKSHLVAIYDFKQTLPTPHRDHGERIR